MPDHAAESDPAMFDKIAADVEAILSGDDSSVTAPVKLAAQLTAAGIDFHLIVDHATEGESGEHRHALILDDVACEQLAERVECSPMGLNLRRAGQALARLGEVLQRDMTATVFPTAAAVEASGAVLVDVDAERPVPAYGDAEVAQLAAELESSIEPPQDGA